MSDPKDKDQPTSPDSLSQTGDTGIELNDNQLENASGGVANTWKVDSFKLTEI
jgi:hypothetical protein